MSGCVSRLAASCVVVLAAGLAGCITPGVTVSSWESSPLLAPRGADRLVLVDGEGRASAKRAFADLIVEQARGGFFRVDDRGDEGLKLVLVGGTGRVEGGRPPAPRELFLRLDVLAWRETRTTTIVKDDDGVEREVPSLHGEADVQVSVVDAAGQVLVREREYRGRADLELDDDGPTPIDAAALEAARAATVMLLGELLPKRTIDRLDFDDGDRSQQQILEAAGREPLATTERRLRRFLKREPDNAIATFNLAVVLDAQGRFEDALALYDRALARVNRDGFAAGRAGCLTRKTRWEAVYGARPAPAAPSQATPPPAPAPAGPAPSGPTAPPPAA